VLLRPVCISFHITVMTLEKRILLIPALFGLLSVLVSCAHKPLVDRKPATIACSVPKAKWVLEWPASDFQVRIRAAKPDGTEGYCVLTSENTGIAVSIYVKRAATCQDSKSCRDLEVGKI